MLHLDKKTHNARPQTLHFLSTATAFTGLFSLLLTQVDLQPSIQEHFLTRGTVTSDTHPLRTNTTQHTQCFEN